MNCNPYFLIGDGGPPSESVLLKDDWDGESRIVFCDFWQHWHSFLEDYSLDRAYISKRSITYL